MDDAAAASGIATVGVVLFLAPALALFFGGIPSRDAARWLAAIAVLAVLVATGEWMLLGQPPMLALFQGSVSAVPVLVIAAIGLREGRRASLSVFLAIWLVAVVVPFSFSLFDVANGPLIVNLGTLDFAGACALGVIPGTAAIALALVPRRGGVAIETPPRRPWWVFLWSMAGGILGFVAVAIGAELVIDETTGVLVVNALLAAGGGVVGWTAAQIATVHRASRAGATAGVFAGSIVVLPASPWLQPVAVIVLAVIAGLRGHLSTIAMRSTRVRAWSAVVGVCLVPACVGMVGAGIVAAGPGLLYSGHTELAVSQLQGLALVAIASLVIASAIAGMIYLVGNIDRVRAFRR